MERKVTTRERGKDYEEQKRYIKKIVAGCMMMAMGAVGIDFPAGAMEEESLQSVWKTEDGSLKMIYVSMEDIELVANIPVTGDCGEVEEPDINGASEDFFNDCSTDYGFKQLDSKENSEELKKLYVNILDVLQETYYSTNNIEKSDFGGAEYYCVGKVDYSTLGLTNEELFQVYTTVLYDHPLLYFTNSNIVYDGMELYMIMDEVFENGTRRWNDTKE